MITGLCDAETKYFRSLRKIAKCSLGIDKTLADNQNYYGKLYELYNETDNPEDKLELQYELNYLMEQSMLLNNIQLNNMEK